MTAINLGRIALQARIALIRAGVVTSVIAILLLLGITSWIWLTINARTQQQELDLSQVRQGQREPLAGVVAVQDGSVSERNLRKFYAVLGDRSEIEQNLKILFSIAAETGLSLDQGEYQWQLDKDGRTYRYQIILPVKGGYRDIRRFCEQALLALPFASLDELSLKRDSVGDDVLDVNLRFTLYLKDETRAPQDAGMTK